jgi:hypothetical protein
MISKKKWVYCSNFPNQVLTALTSRRFFKNHSVSSEITGIDETLIIQLGVILQCLSSGQKLHTDGFENYR